MPYHHHNFHNPGSIYNSGWRLESCWLLAAILNVYTDWLYVWWCVVWVYIIIVCVCVCAAGWGWLADWLTIGVVGFHTVHGKEGTKSGIARAVEGEWEDFGGARKEDMSNVFFFRLHNLQRREEERRIREQHQQQATPGAPSSGHHPHQQRHHHRHRANVRGKAAASRSRFQWAHLKSCNHLTLAPGRLFEKAPPTPTDSLDQVEMQIPRSVNLSLSLSVSLLYTLYTLCTHKLKTSPFYSVPSHPFYSLPLPMPYCLHIYKGSPHLLFLPTWQSGIPDVLNSRTLCVQVGAFHVGHRFWCPQNPCVWTVITGTIGFVYWAAIYWLWTLL